MTKYHEHTETRQKVDALLKKIAEIESNLGKDSTPRERTNAKIKQQKLLLEIKNEDPEFYEEIEPNRNETEDDKKLKNK